MAASHGFGTLTTKASRAGSSRASAAALWPMDRAASRHEFGSVLACIARRLPGYLQPDRLPLDRRSNGCCAARCRALRALHRRCAQPVPAHRLAAGAQRLPFTTVVVGRFAELAPAIWLYAGNTVLLGLVSFALIGALFQGVVSSGVGPAAHTQGHYITTVIASACRTALLSLALLWPHLGGGSRSSWGQDTSMSYTRSEFPADLLAGEPSVERPARRKRGSFIRVLITFCAGVAATLAWQSYGDAAREIIANSYPQFS